MEFCKHIIQERAKKLSSQRLSYPLSVLGDKLGASESYNYSQEVTEVWYIHTFTAYLPGIMFCADWTDWDSVAFLCMFFFCLFLNHFNWVFLSYIRTHEAEQNILEEEVCEETLLIERVGDMPFSSNWAGIIQDCMCVSCNQEAKPFNLQCYSSLIRMAVFFCHVPNICLAQ